MDHEAIHLKALAEIRHFVGLLILYYAFKDIIFEFFRRTAEIYLSHYTNPCLVEIDTLQIDFLGGCVEFSGCRIKVNSNCDHRWTVTTIVEAKKVIMLCFPLRYIVGYLLTCGDLVSLNSILVIDVSICPESIFTGDDGDGGVFGAKRNDRTKLVNIQLVGQTKSIKRKAAIAKLNLEERGGNTDLLRLQRDFSDPILDHVTDRKQSGVVVTQNPEQQKSFRYLFRHWFKKPMAMVGDVYQDAMRKVNNSIRSKMDDFYMKFRGPPPLLRTHEMRLQCVEMKFLKVKMIMRNVLPKTLRHLEERPMMIERMQLDHVGACDDECIPHTIDCVVRGTSDGIVERVLGAGNAASVVPHLTVGQQSGGRCDHDTGDPAYHMRRYCCLDGSNLSDSDMESVGSTWESVSSVEEDMDQAGAMGHSSSASTNGHDYASFNNSSTSSLSIKADVAYASFGLVKSLVFNASKGNSVGIASPTLQYYMEKQLMMELFKSNAGRLVYESLAKEIWDYNPNMSWMDTGNDFCHVNGHQFDETREAAKCHLRSDPMLFQLPLDEWLHKAHNVNSGGTNRCC